MSSPSRLLSAVGLVLLAVLPVRAADGVRVIRPASGTGEGLVIPVTDKPASQALTRTLRSLAGRFDKAPQILGVVATRDGKEAQAVFAASRGGKPVLGLAVVYLGARDGVAGVVYDRPEQLRASAPELMRQITKGMPRSGPAALEWHNTRLADGSGTIRVPAGWVLNPVNSMVSGTGPQGSIDLGLWTPVWLPGPVARLNRTKGDPLDSFVMGAQLYHSTLKAEWKLVKVHGRKQAVGFPGRAEWLHIEAEVKGGPKPGRYQTFALVSTQPLVDGRWLCYGSMVTAPSATFERDFPVLLEIWASWKTDDAVFRKRLAEAAASMRETARIIREVNDSRQRVMDRACDDWSETIRETRIVRDDRTGLYHEVSANYLDRLLEGLNRHEGYQRWSIIPLKDLRNP